MLKREKDASLATLRRLFVPSVVLKLARRRRAEREEKARREVAVPTFNTLKSCPLLEKWPSVSLRRLLHDGRLIVRERLTPIAFEGEPRHSSCMHYVISGKLTQVPTKADLQSCAMGIPTLAVSNVARTVATVFPTLFNERKFGVEEPLAPMQELILSTLGVYTQGDLVDMESMLLGSSQRNTITCMTTSILFEIPYASVMREVSLLKGPPHTLTLQHARNIVAGRMSQRESKPELNAILHANPILSGLSTETLKVMRTQLKPVVFSAGETICADIFLSDRIFFLSDGEVMLATTGMTAKTTVSGIGASIGLHSFAAHQFPASLDGSRQYAVAKGYCEAWSLNLQELLALCGEGGNQKCVQLATQKLRKIYPERIRESNRNGSSSASSSSSSGVAAIAACLRKVSAFLYLADSAVEQIAKTLKLRVYAPGECIIPARQPVKAGVIILCGKCVFAATRLNAEGKEAGVGKSRRVDVGLPIYIYEALARLVTPDEALLAETSSIVLCGSQACILDALEYSHCSSDEIAHLLDTAEGYVEATYGRGHVEQSKAQNRAVKRIKEYQRKQRAETVAQLAAAAEARSRAAGRKVDREDEELESFRDGCKALQTQNQVMTSLSLHLQSLHTSALEGKRYAFLRGLQKDVVMESGEAEGAQGGGGETRRNHRYRPECCFTVDEKGEVIFSEGPVEEVEEPRDVGGVTEGANRVASNCGGEACITDETETLGQPATWESVPSSPVVASEYSHAAYTQAVVASPAPRSSTAPPPTDNVSSLMPIMPLQNLRSLSSQKGVLRTMDLRVPVSAVRSTSHLLTSDGRPYRKPAPPSRLATMRASVANMKDQADGFDTRAEYRRALFKRNY